MAKRETIAALQRSHDRRVQDLLAEIHLRDREIEQLKSEYGQLKAINADLRLRLYRALSTEGEP
jgi:hypothetical protein